MSHDSALRKRYNKMDIYRPFRDVNASFFTILSTVTRAAFSGVRYQEQRRVKLA